MESDGESGGEDGGDATVDTGACFEWSGANSVSISFPNFTMKFEVTSSWRRMPII